METKMRVLALIWIAAIIALATGWVMNVITIFHTADAPMTGVFILRCLGVVMPPLGGVLGWF